MHCDLGSKLLGRVVIFFPFFFSKSKSIKLFCLPKPIPHYVWGSYICNGSGSRPQISVNHLSPKSIAIVFSLSFLNNMSHCFSISCRCYDKNSVVMVMDDVIGFSRILEESIVSIWPRTLVFSQFLNIVQKNTGNSAFLGHLSH